MRIAITYSLLTLNTNEKKGFHKHNRLIDGCNQCLGIYPV